MTAKILFIFLLGCIIFFSCGNNQDNSEANLQQQQLFRQQEEQLHEQLYIDSVNRARAIADSIEKERKKRLIEEDKQRKISDATDIIKSFSSSLMNKVSPATGRNLNWNILYEESSYDELTSTMNVVFETNWDAIPDFNWNSTYQTHTFKGKIILYGTGEIRKEEISENDVLVRAIKASSAAEQLIDLLSKNSSNN